MQILPIVLIRIAWYSNGRMGSALLLRGGGYFERCCQLWALTAQPTDKVRERTSVRWYLPGIEWYVQGIHREWRPDLQKHEEP